VPHKPEKPVAEETSDPEEILQREATKIKSAVRTDFILSVEIIIISLETVIEQSLTIQIMVVSFIALLATVGVYGLVAVLVRMDDAGCYLIRQAATMKGAIANLLKVSGEVLVASLPKVIRLLSVIGTVAMLLVGGGMFVHNIDAVHHALEAFPSLTAELLVGLIVGSGLLGGMQLTKVLKTSLS
jgi:predicted DNA repair protein MutK